MLGSLKSLFGRGSDGRYWFGKMVTEAKFPGPVCDALLRLLISTEKTAINEIEAVRKRTEKDRREVTMMDYGAGSSTEHRTADQMAAGVPTRRIIGDVCKAASKSPAWCEILFKLVRYQRPTACIEMGTCLGISASYIGMALKMNGHGRLVTLEGADAFADVARMNLRTLGLDNTTVKSGKFSTTLLPALLEMKPVDFMFIDGHHDRDATLHYTEQSRPFLAEHNILVFDDIDWSDGMREAWAKIKDSTTGFALGNIGVCLDVRLDPNPEPGRR
jgi:predicted O-methyltransferase YrrM